VQGRAERRDVPHLGCAFERFEHGAGIVAFDEKDLAVDRATLEFARTAQRRELAAVDERDPIAIFGLVHIVRGDDHAHASLRERIDEVPEAAAGCGIDPGGRLV